MSSGQEELILVDFICSTTVVSFRAFRKRLRTTSRIIRCDWDWKTGMQAHASMHLDMQVRISILFHAT